MNHDDKLLTLILSVCAVGLLLALAVGILQPYFEARAFNKFTDGPKATYWDAMWTELRVMAE